MSDNCPAISRTGFPQRFVNILLEKYSTGFTGRWSDYNCMHMAWNKFRDFGYGSNMMCADQIPGEPQAQDFADLESPDELNQCHQNVSYVQRPK